MEFNLFTERSSGFITCSKCGTKGNVSRMKINSDTEKIIYRIFRLRKYHCNECKHDKVYFNYRLKKNSGRILLNNLVFLAGLILLTIITYYIMKRYF